MTAVPLGAAMTWRRAATPIAQVAALCTSAWDIEGRISPLPSERDEIFRIDGADGRCFTLKLTSPREEAIATDFQTQALLHASSRNPALPVPRLVPDRDGRVAFKPEWPGDHVPTARLLTWLVGVPLASAPRSARQAAALGEALALLGLAWEDFDHPGADHDLDWDLANTARLRPLLDSIVDREKRAITQAAMDRFEEQTAHLLPTLRRQVIHNDLNPHNALVDAVAPEVLTGIIDFGDLVRTLLVADVAIAATYLLGQGEDAMAMPAALIAAYHRVRPLEVRELSVITPLMEARHLMTVAITEWRAARNPDNRAYITKNTQTAWNGLATFASRPAEYWFSKVFDACNTRIG